MTAPTSMVKLTANKCIITLDALQYNAYNYYQVKANNNGENKMTYQVVSKKECAKVSGVSLTGKSVTIDSNHCGHKAVCVKLDSGFMDWGFAETWDDAEKRAVKKAKALEAA